MGTWKKIALVNGGGLVGIIISLFIVSSPTPLWLWATLSGVALTALNYICFGWRRTAGGEATSGAKSTTITIFGFIILLLDLIYRYFYRK
jgi:hypothetical protein